MAWDAVFYHPEASRSPRVRVMIGQEGLLIRDQDSLLMASWNYDSLYCQEPPCSGQPLVLGCSDNPLSRLTVLDPSFSADLQGIAPQVFQLGRSAHSKAARPRRPSFTLWPRPPHSLWPKACLLSLLSGLLVVGVALLLGGYWLWQTISHFFSPQAQAPLALGLPPACQGVNGQRVLDQLGDRLAIGARLSPAPFLLVVDYPEPQIFSMQGRTIILTSALLESLQSSDELAALIAHEMGHITQKSVPSFYGERRNGQQQALSVGCLTESAEIEADGWALRTLQTAGLDPLALPRVLNHLPYAHAGAVAPPWQAMACTHPITHERLSALPQPTGKPFPEDPAQAVIPQSPLPSNPSSEAMPALSSERWAVVKSMCRPQDS